MIQVLPDSNAVADILKDEFQCMPPPREHGDIVGVYEDGELKAFMCRELLLHIGTVWVNPKDRKTAKGAKWLKQLTRYVIVNMPLNGSALVADETGLYDRLLRFIGLRRIPGQAYRIDFIDS